MEYLGSGEQYSESKMKVIIESIKYAAKAVHMVGIANIKCKNAYEAIPLTNKKEMWDVLQQYYKNYKGFINNLSNFTGYYIFSVDKIGRAHV